MADVTALSPGVEILVLEDDAPLRKRIAGYLRQTGAEVAEAGRLAEARRLLGEMHVDFALIDLQLPDGGGMDLLREGAFSENTTVVVMTAFGTTRAAVEAMQFGASDYLSKPFELDELPVVFARSRASRRGARREEHWKEQTGAAATRLFFGPSLDAVRQQLDQILAMDRRLGQQLPPVLIEGETGTGKSALAQWLHLSGPRSAQPFVTINCAALPETLAESELFGHERGAFTDARRARIGLFEAADGGTLFLDEIGTLAASTQAKLLLAVEEGRIRRLGATRETRVDARVIVANHRPLAELVREGTFREDLYHRLDLLRLRIPPLRERGADVVALARHLLAEIARRHRMPPPQITPEGEIRLLAQGWPGNVRELSHELERALIFGSGGPLDFAHLAPAANAALPTWRNSAWRLPETGFSLDQAIDQFIADALRETNGNVSAAARRLGVTRDFIRYRLSGNPPADLQAQ